MVQYRKTCCGGIQCVVGVQASIFSPWLVSVPTHRYNAMFSIQERSEPAWIHALEMDCEGARSVDYEVMKCVDDHYGKPSLCCVNEKMNQAALNRLGVYDTGATGYASLRFIYVRSDLRNDRHVGAKSAACLLVKLAGKITLFYRTCQTEPRHFTNAMGLETYRADHPIVVSSRSGREIDKPGRTAAIISGSNPFLHCEGQPYLAAGGKILTLGEDTFVIVDVVLPAVLGLVLVREAGVEA